MPQPWSTSQQAKLDRWVADVGEEFARASFYVLLRTWPIVSKELKNSPGPPTPLTVSHNEHLLDRVRVVAPQLRYIEILERWKDANPKVFDQPKWVKDLKKEVDRHLLGLSEDLRRLL